MKIVLKMQGGLGNQMFQYAFAKLLQYKTDADTFIDLSTYNADSKEKVRKPRILKLAENLHWNLLIFLKILQ